MADKCRKAGHRGDYKTYHLFDDTANGGLVSASGLKIFSVRVVELRTSARLRS